jgi:transposase
MTANILNLPEFEITEIDETDHDYRIDVQSVADIQSCAHCQHHEMVRFGRRTEVIMDTPIHGKRVGIWINRRRYRCQGCGRTFYEPIKCKDSKRLATNRLVAFIERQAVSRTFAQIADDVGIDEKTVRNIFSDYCERMNATLDFAAPRYLGIDEIHIIKRPRLVLTNIEQRTLLDMVKTRTKTTVQRYLMTMKGKENVRFVAMDMWPAYRDSVYSCLPNATVVIDKFHVVKMANQGMESARKALKDSIPRKANTTLKRERFVLLRRKREMTMPEKIAFDSWTMNYPLIGEAYQLKEDFFNIWDSGFSRADAELAYRTWEDRLVGDMAEHFLPLTRAVNNWWTEVFNYFDHPITNAYTESLNNLIRAVNRDARGYSFEALRAKMLFTQGTHKTAPKRRPYQRDENAWGRMSYYTMSDPKPADYGIDISTLTRKFDSGEI